MTLTTGTKLVLFGFIIGVLCGFFVAALVEVAHRDDDL